MSYSDDTGKSIPAGMTPWRTRTGWELITLDAAARRREIADRSMMDAAIAASTAKQAVTYPRAWPKKHCMLLDLVRSEMAADPVMRWSWNKDRPDGRGRPKGSFAIDYDDDREPLVFVTLDAAAEYYQLGDAPKVKRTGKVDLVKLLARLLDSHADGGIHDDLVAEAQRLLEAA